MPARARPDSHLFWGAVLLLVGGLWLLSTTGWFGGLACVSLAGSLTLGILSGVSWLAYRRDPACCWGFLIPAGLLGGLSVLALNEAFELLPSAFDVLFLFGGLALAFGRIHALDRARHWALLCTWIAVVVGLTSFVGGLDLLGGDLAGTIFLWGAAVPFAWYFLRSGREWAIIPAGSLAACGLLPLTDGRLPEAVQAPLVLLSLAATFGLYYVAGKPGRVGWARFPALGLAALALLTMFATLARPLLNIGLPLLLIAIGLYLVLHARAGDSQARGDGGEPAPPPA